MQFKISVGAGKRSDFKKQGNQGMDVVLISSLW